ncbi:cysteine dioxygenase family protein [Amycolatopsis umgeniensis]|uniref:Putative metal-dependent enzyme (Double-stranded beta helix superfamily) n=1 Tax=Amycolatopsis umgeniensis TaxID=336628 RepID=A0A841AYZ3_9PSEU|nr:cysteine dioxygenase family protein [Amycolatopsis umgeniensis]MBB5852073.1 putative metal-dependent enzyme (double-stranded beta helix superfamily) [Amycolatopsis umgeniensis]
MTTASTTPAVSARPGLAELIKRLRECTRRTFEPHATALTVASVLTELRPTPNLLTPVEREGAADGYTRTTLHAESAFSIAALVWRPGQLTEIHDHLVWCTFLVLQGTETENVFDIDGDRLVRTAQRQRPAGSVSGVAPPDDIHQVHNTGDTVAITLHVYGADLSKGTSVRRKYRMRATPK